MLLQSLFLVIKHQVKRTWYKARRDNRNGFIEPITRDQWSSRPGWHNALLFLLSLVKQKWPNQRGNRGRRSLSHRKEEKVSDEMTNRSVAAIMKMRPLSAIFSVLRHPPPPHTHQGGRWCHLWWIRLFVYFFVFSLLSAVKHFALTRACFGKRFTPPVQEARLASDCTADWCDTPHRLHATCSISWTWKNVSALLTGPTTKTPSLIWFI